MTKEEEVLAVKSKAELLDQKKKLKYELKMQKQEFKFKRRKQKEREKQEEREKRYQARLEQKQKHREAILSSAITLYVINRILIGIIIFLSLTIVFMCGFFH